jgi:YhcH/YjgK/YiaL family protein
MIFGNITDWVYYFEKSDIFKEMFQELSKISTNTGNGEYRLNDQIYYKVMGYDTQISPSVIESHKKEVDVQIILKGKERIKVFNTDAVKVTVPYNEENDCQFYSIEKQSFTEFNLVPGKMAVFFPKDIHACQYAVDNNVETIKKIVFKIDEELFTH